MRFYVAGRDQLKIGSVRKALINLKIEGQVFFTGAKTINFPAQPYGYREITEMALRDCLLASQYVKENEIAVGIESGIVCDDFSEFYQVFICYLWQHSRLISPFYTSEKTPISSTAVELARYKGFDTHKVSDISMVLSIPQTDQSELRLIECLERAITDYLN